MAVDYNDERFKNVESQEKQALQNVNNTYNTMIQNSDKYYNDMAQAAENYGQQQAEIQQANTDFAIEQINQQKEQAEKDYTKEQKGAYTDWQKQANQYGVNAEQLASAGLRNTGYSESSQVSMYNTYQNRIGQARETYNRAVLDYDNGIKEAQLQNNAALAEIAYQALQTKLELGLNQFQYKNDLIQSQLTMQNQTSDRYYERYQDVLKQINTENALKEEQRQFDKQYALQQKAAKSSSSSSKTATISKSSGSNTSSIGSINKNGTTTGQNVSMQTKAGQNALNYITNFVSGDPDNSKNLTPLDIRNIEKYLGNQLKNGMTQEEYNYINDYINNNFTKAKAAWLESAYNSLFKVR